MAVYPALALLAANVDQVPLSQGFRILAVSLLVGVLVYLGARLVFRRWDNAALAASLILIVLLSYGRLYDGLKAAGLSGETIVRHRYLIPACVGLVAAGLVVCARRRETAGLNRVLNAASVVAVAFPILAIAFYQANALGARQATQAECTLQPAAGEPLPDVYIIIMDAYTRDDVLREFHEYDNSPFLDSLKAMGFYVAHGSMSNFRWTRLSFPSFLNMEYLQDFPERFGTRPNQVWDIVLMIGPNRVRQELECLGYVTVALETGHFETEWNDADYFLHREMNAVGGGQARSINRLEHLFLKTTAVRLAYDGVAVSRAAHPPEALDQSIDWRERILFVFDQMADIPALPAPKLVYVHIISPHPPFVFGPNGEPVNEADFETSGTGPARELPLLDAYEDQVTYLNKRLLESLQIILAQSDPTPIIVLMGDHGWADRNMEDKLSILNAYLVPPEAAERLYPTITPVNSFRVIFDAVFGGSYGLLEDRSYYSGTNALDFIQVPNTWEPEPP